MPLYNPNFGYLTSAFRSLEAATAHYPDPSKVSLWVTDDSELNTDIPPLPIGGSYQRNSERQGMANNWNLAASMGEAPLIAFLLQDDEWSAKYLCHGATLLAGYTDVVAIGVGRKFIGDDSRPLRTRRPVTDRQYLIHPGELTILDGRDAAYLLLRNGNVLGEPSAVVVRRSVFDMSEGFDAAFGHAADLDFNLRICRFGKVALCGDRLLRRRLHAERLTEDNRRTGRIVADRLALLDAHRPTQLWAASDPLRKSRVDAANGVRLLADSVRMGTRGRIRMARRAWAAVSSAGLRATSRLIWEILSHKNQDRKVLQKGAVQ